MTATVNRIISTIRTRRPGVLDVYFGTGKIQATVEREFFSSLRMPNGTSKTSSDRRLDDLNELLDPLLPRKRVISVMDVAAGSAISTVEWADQLRAGGRDARFVVGDLHVHGWLTTFGRRCAILYLEDGTPCTLESHGRQLDLTSNRPVVRGIRTGAALAFRLQARTAAAEALAPPRSWRRVHRRIPLLSPRVLERTEIEVVPDDLGEPGLIRERFDVVRAANILNRGYFDEPTLSRFVANLIGRVKEDGLLAICRTASDGTNQATVFRRTGDRIVVQARLGGGSEVEGLASQVAPR